MASCCLFLLLIFLRVFSNLGMMLISATIVACISLSYVISKDAFVYVQKKAHYSKNLDKNYDDLRRALEFFPGLRTRIESSRMSEGIRLIFDKWKKRVEQIGLEAGVLFDIYEHTRTSSWVFSRAKLSKDMGKLLEEATKLKNEGKQLANELCRHNPGITIQSLRWLRNKMELLGEMVVVAPFVLLFLLWMMLILSVSHLKQILRWLRNKMKLLGEIVVVAPFVLLFLLWMMLILSVSHLKEKPVARALFFLFLFTVLRGFSFV